MGLSRAHHGAHRLPLLPAHRAAPGDRQLLRAPELQPGARDAPALVLLVPGDLRLAGDRRGQRLPPLREGIV